MSLRIAGMGWVTPLGRGVDNVWERLLRGDEAIGQTVSREDGKETFPVFLVPKQELKSLPPHSRLRRASAISQFGAAAGLDAMENARALIGEIDLKRTALIFAVSNGGVIYTKRFYHDVIVSGAQAARPLLFPETVFNAPASHLAAILGLTGASYTLVGDGAVGTLALKMAADLIESGQIDSCLVVGAEEADWLLCDAYRRWRLLKPQPPIDLFRRPPRGMIPSEGAGAILLGREGKVGIEQVHSGGIFWRRQQATKLIAQVISDLSEAKANLFVGSANGTFIDLAESSAMAKIVPRMSIYSCKPALGESVGASAIWQVIVAAQSLATGKVPPLLHLEESNPLTRQHPQQPNGAIVLSCGMNQQVAGARLAI